MPDLIIERNQETYTGLYSEPAFDLWGEGSKILRGLYGAFQSFGVTLSDIRAESGTVSPADEGVVVYLGRQASYRFKFDRVEANISNFVDDQLSDFGRVLSQGDRWLRSILPELRFSSHLFSYSAHGRFVDRSSGEFLSAMSSPSLHALGTDRGTGLIWHADHEPEGWRLQLTVDHSLLISDGLFVQFVVITLEESLQHSEVIAKARELLERSLNELGLRLRYGSES